MSLCQCRAVASGQWSVISSRVQKAVIFYLGNGSGIDGEIPGDSLHIRCGGLILGDVVVAKV